MRSLNAATLVGVSALAAASSATSSGLEPTTESTRLQLHLPVGEDGFEIVGLHLDFHASDEICDPSAISINGELLARDENNSGSGTLELEDGRFITAEWHSTCNGHEETIEMTAFTFEGDDIPPVSFSVTFTNSPDASDGNVVLGQQHVDDAPPVENDGDVKDSYSSAQRPPQQSSKGFKNCETLRCMWHALKDDVKTTASDVREKVLHSHDNHHDMFQTMIQAGGNSQEQPLGDSFNSKQSYSGQQHHIDADHGLRLFESPREALWSALAIALLGFTLFSLFSLLYTHRERIRAALAERRARRRSRGFRTWAERRAARKARQQARKQAIRDFVSRIFRSLTESDAEKRAAEEERRQALVERQVEEGRIRDNAQNFSASTWATPGEQQTSMAQELAGLRTAVAMVDDIVNASRPRAEQPQSTQPPPIPPRPPIPGFFVYDDRLPTYEEQIHDSAVVADGFQYQPGVTRPDFTSRSATGWSSDRLGYDK